jgi:hypothetical protein
MFSLEINGQGVTFGYEGRRTAIVIGTIGSSYTLCLDPNVGKGSPLVTRLSNPMKTNAYLFAHITLECGKLHGAESKMTSTIISMYCIIVAVVLSSLDS